jgi:hypothetical protein
MYKKMTLKNLSFVFISLLILVALVLLIDQKKGKRTFRTDLFDADTAEITAIIIHPKGDQSKPLTLIKKEPDWLLKSEEKEFTADPGMVKEMLRTLNDLKASRVAATDKARWQEFEVDDSLSTRVLVKKGRKTVSTLYIGRFSYQMPKNANPYDYYNQQAKISTYVRVGDEKFVYVVEGFLSMVFNRNLNDFRNKVIIRSNRNDWNRLTFSYGADSSFVMTREKGLWSVDGTIIDSALADEYLSSVTWISSEDFVDDQKPVSDKPDFSLKIEGNNMVSPVVISAFTADTTHGYLIRSSLNEGVYFSGKKSGLTERIFISRKKLLGSEK